MVANDAKMFCNCESDKDKSKYNSKYTDRDITFVSVLETTCFEIQTYCPPQWSVTMCDLSSFFVSIFNLCVFNVCQVTPEHQMPWIISLKASPSLQNSVVSVAQQHLVMPVTSTVHLVLFQGETVRHGMTQLLMTIINNAQIEILAEKSFVFTRW